MPLLYEYLANKRKKQLDELEAAAHARVNASPRLRPYEEIIFYDWADWEAHMLWIVEEGVENIIAWAEHIKIDSEGVTYE